MTAGVRGRLAAVRQRATDSRGLALTEMIVVLAILVVVLTALTQLFVSASKAEVDMSKRVQAQQNARLALDKLRREIHCAKGVTLAGGPARSARTVRTLARSRSRSAPYCSDEHRPALTTTCHVVHEGQGRRLRRLGAGVSAITLWRYTRQLVLGNRHGSEIGPTTSRRPTAHECSRTTPPHVARRGLLGTLERRPAGRPHARRCEAAVHAPGRHRPAQHTAVDEPRPHPSRGGSEQPIGDKSWPPRLQHSRSFPGLRSEAS